MAAAADTWISSAPRHKNHGDESTLRVGGPGAGRALVRVETSNIASTLDGWELVSARLELEIDGVSNAWGNDGADARTVDLHRVRTAWTELGATWLSPTQTGPHASPTWDMEAQILGNCRTSPAPPAPSSSGRARAASWPMT